MGVQLNIAGVTLTSEGQGALDSFQGIFPELNEKELLEILVGLIQEDPKLDYIIKLARGEDIGLVSCLCSGCQKENIMSLGWIGHRKWINSGLCPVCSMRRK